jgi:hypothetical protein
MKHFSLEAWTDFARNQTPEADRLPMQEHLDACEECAETVRRFRRLAELAGREPGYLPPSSAVRCAKALYHVRPPAAKPSWDIQIARLVTSAFHQPALEGVRGGAAPVRHLLYRRGALLLDMHMEPRPECELVAMIGQLLEPEQPDAEFGSRPVAVLKGSDELARTVTNQFGEFQLEFCPGENLMLVVDLEREVILVSPLPQTPAEAAPSGRVD